LKKCENRRGGNHLKKGGRIISEGRENVLPLAQTKKEKASGKKLR